MNLLSQWLKFRAARATGFTVRHEPSRGFGLRCSSTAFERARLPERQRTRAVQDTAAPILLLFAALFLAQGGSAQIPAMLSYLASTNPLVWDAREKFAKQAEMNQNATFTFWVTNTSSSNAFIVHTESECDCTVTKMPSQPWVLQPGESGSLDVKMNLLGRFGRVTKEIYVGTSHGGQTLRVNADIPLTPAPFNVSARQRDQMAAKKDRQAVFGGGCAACHALPATGRTGEALFTKACAICHISTQRAAMVPDLAALRTPTHADYWRTWITQGKAGTLMPAFAQSAGGILDTNQIESLVEFLVKAYPAAAAPTSAPTAP